MKWRTVTPFSYSIGLVEYLGSKLRRVAGLFTHLYGRDITVQGAAGAHRYIAQSLLCYRQIPRDDTVCARMLDSTLRARATCSPVLRFLELDTVVDRLQDPVRQASFALRIVVHSAVVVSSPTRAVLVRCTAVVHGLSPVFATPTRMRGVEAADRGRLTVSIAAGGILELVSFCDTGIRHADGPVHKETLD